jgi:DNA repair photolyase
MRIVRRIDNPPNPYLSSEVAWLAEPPAVEVEVFEETARSILSRNDSPDVGFEWSVNPYRGCLHACAYCYARPGHEMLGFGAGTDFESKLIVKRNAPELLREAFRRRSWKGDLVAFSGDTDCYQPLEVSYRLTRRCLEVCRDFQNPVGVVTKSALVQRDRALLAELAADGAAEVTFSIAFHDPVLQKKVEPGAPSPRLRFDALRAVAEAGVPCSVLVAPVIPWLNDHEIPKILEVAAAAGARSAGMILLRLSGSVRPVFFGRIERAFPDRVDRIEARLRDVRDGGITDGRFFHRHRGTGTYWKAISDLFSVHCQRLGLDRRTDAVGPSPFRRPGPVQGELFGPP